MIVTDTIKLEVVLGGAVTANQPEVVVIYSVHNIQGTQTKPLIFRTATNSGTDVTILAATGIQGEVHEVQRLSVYNKDTASVTVIIKTDDGTTERIVMRAVLLTLETLHFEKGAGWYATDANGEIKTA